MATRAKARGGRQSTPARKQPQAPQPQLFQQGGSTDERPMYTLPTRFFAESHPDQQIISITDRETGKSALVAMGAWGEVRRALGALFGGEIEGKSSYVPPAVAPLAEPPAAKAAAKSAAKTASKPATGKTGQAASVFTGVSPAAKAAAKGSAGKAAAKGASKAPPVNKGAVKLPAGWDAEIEGEGYRMEFGADPETNLPGYRIVRGRSTVGWLRQEGPTRFLLYSPNRAWPESVHRNVLGARMRLDVMYEES